MQGLINSIQKGETMSERKKIGLPYLFQKVQDKEPISWLTCYDYPTAYLQEQAGVEMILVGDSLGMTMLGYDSTLPVTMEDMIRHASAVRRGAPTAFVIGDMPYMSYQPSNELAVLNAGRFMAEAGCDAIKLEGGHAMGAAHPGYCRCRHPRHRTLGADAPVCRRAGWL
jgi:3-methyl-2-oxobutanoate hydroxymethyltransferase